jgi:xylulokinase
MRNYLGLDIGTSGCKAAVFDANGRLLSLARREYDLLLTPDGGAELDSDVVINDCLAVITEARAQAGGEVQAMAVSSQGEAFTAVGSDGRALCHAMVSSDVRAAGFARDWPKVFGEERLYQITGHTAHPLFTLFKLLWLREHRPQVWSQAAKFLCFEDLLHLRLGLAPAIGWPLAGRTMLFDVRCHEWSPEILNAVGLSASRFARPLPSGSVVGRTGDGMLVVAGGHDQSCCALGAGGTRPGTALFATGSVECLTPAFAQPVFSETLRLNNLCTYDHAAPGLYTTVAYSLTGGNLFKWFRAELGRDFSYDQLLSEMPDQPTRLLVLPYWTPSGTPFFDCETPGAILGLRLSTRRGELLRAMLEGVAFEMRLNLGLLEQAGVALQELRVVGGGARSDVWNQLRADLLGKPLTRMEVTEAGCLGAAMLAAAAESGRPVDQIAETWIKPGERFEPKAQNSQFYSEQFVRYQQLRPAVRSVFSRPNQPGLC